MGSARVPLTQFTNRDMFVESRPLMKAVSALCQSPLGRFASSEGNRADIGRSLAPDPIPLLGCMPTSLSAPRGPKQLLIVPHLRRGRKRSFASTKWSCCRVCEWTHIVTTLDYSEVVRCRMIVIPDLNGLRAACKSGQSFRYRPF